MELILEKPLILVDPLPRTLGLICDAETRRRLEALGTLVISEDGPMHDDVVERHLPEVALIIGQTPMDRARLGRARKLKAIVNVETNFLPNVDYGYCAERGIYVLTPSAAFAQAVAEASLAMAIDLCRGITAADRDFRRGAEKYGLEGNAKSFMFAGAPVGIVGFGDLGRTLRALIAPFRCPVAVHDPWLPDALILSHDAAPSDLDDLIKTSRVVFMFASATSENQGFIGKREFDLMQPGSAFLLMSRAAVVDFPEFVRQVREGRILGATDVFPEEPVGSEDAVRSVEGMLLSAHRTGGMADALHKIGRMTVADAELVLRGLPPQLCRRADPAVAARIRSKPVSVT
jgi:phosphoglycerate dehydrogenase-like enzyme